MYKVYVNGVPFYMGTPDSTGDLGLIMDKNAYNAPYLGKRKQIKQYLDMLDKKPNVSAVVLYADNPEALWADFQSCFTILEAAGGYVLNTEQQLLVFYRRGSWDMPKGKIDPGESPEEAAIREVNEETGLQHLELGVHLMDSWHTYTQKGERILKKTWWYAMRTTDTNVVPQTEEDIERIEWVDPKVWVAAKPSVYRSILDVIECGMAQ
jgi:8-oxo-dGTP pyrophosphatase MutT (NUDIX family)